ncbi:MAG: type IV secretory system conjugative DNA transfer family protein [Lachnospiraceae bacterium]|nr:type IV secretory system conjugative DNA transfer family protein [Lachnospiraceae bacterium]
MLNKKKPNYGFFLFLLVVALYVGYCLGMLYGQEISLDNLTALLQEVLTHPMPIQITPITSRTVLVALLIWLIILAYDISNRRNYMPGREYGSGRLATPKEINKKLMDKDDRKNKIISEHIRISMNSRLTALNNNTVIIGGSGSGKTFYVVKANAYNAGYTSFVFTDPKGELLRDIGNYLEMMGYKVIVLNLVDMDASDGYNPFVYIRCDEDVTKLITNLIANTTPKGSTPNDPFWERSESMLLQAIFLYVWYEFPKQGRTPNFRGVLELLNKAKVSDDEENHSELDDLMYQLPEDHPALITYKKVCTGAADTIRSIIISANARLAYLQNPKVLRIMDNDDIDIPAMGEGVYENPDRKVALFCVIPDNDKSYNFLVGMLYSQIFQELYYIADHKFGGGRLPVPVALWMDEFANCALPDGFLESLATCRSREISCNIIIQNLAQLKTLFKDSWESITGNSDILVYLGGNEQSTHKFISEMLGKTTIDKKSSGETLGNHGSSSRNYDVLGRDILDPSEVRKVDNKKCLIFIKGFDPIYDDKYHTAEKEEYKLAMKLGPYEHKKRQWLQDGRDIFYINGPKGGGNPCESMYYQVENYLGIFEDTTAYEELKKLSDYGEENQLVPVGDGYIYQNKILYPVISRNTVPVKTGLGRLTKHPVVGYSYKGKAVLVDSEVIKEIFTPLNRMT